MHNTTITLLTSLVSRLEREIQLLVDEAEVLKDGYLEWWNPKREMKLVMKPPHETHRQAETGQIRPVIRNRSNINKWYFEWTTEHCHKVKKINSSWSKSITPTKTKGYTKELMAKNSDSWEQERAWALEEKWKPIRIAVNALHKSKTDINKQIRKAKEDGKQNNEV